MRRPLCRVVAVSAAVSLLTVGAPAGPARAASSGCADTLADFVPAEGSRWHGDISAADRELGDLDVTFAGKRSTVRLSDRDYTGTVVFRLNLGWAVERGDATAEFAAVGVLCESDSSRVTEMSGTVTARGLGLAAEPDRFSLRRGT